jgi:hypothetical protein
MTAALMPLLTPLLTGPIARKNLILALVVGTILNAINQGDAFLTGDGIIWWRAVLNFCVPFCVATFGAWNAAR